MWLSFFINSLLVVIVVLIHYETLRQLSIAIPKLKILPRLRILVGVVGALCGHVIEIWVFGLAYYWTSDVNGLGFLQGNWNGSLLDSVYFSFSCYTSLGFGDIEPVGNLRFLAGLEALVGLVLISWDGFVYVPGNDALLAGTVSVEKAHLLLRLNVHE